MNVLHFVLCGRSETKKSPDSLLRLYNTPGKAALACNDGHQVSGFIGWGEGCGAGRGTREPVEMLEIPCTWPVVVVTQVYTFVKIHQTVHLKWVHFLVFELYLKKLIFKNQNKKKKSEQYNTMQSSLQQTCTQRARWMKQGFPSGLGLKSQKELHCVERRKKHTLGAQDVQGGKRMVGCRNGTGWEVGRGHCKKNENWKVGRREFGKGLVFLANNIGLYLWPVLLNHDVLIH